MFAPARLTKRLTKRPSVQPQEKPPAARKPMPGFSLVFPLSDQNSRNIQRAVCAEPCFCLFLDLCQTAQQVDLPNMHARLRRSRRGYNSSVKKGQEMHKRNAFGFSVCTI